MASIAYTDAASLAYLRAQGWLQQFSTRKSCLFVRGTEGVLAFRGTVISNTEDIVCDAALVSGTELSTDRFLSAIAFTKTCVRRFPHLKMYAVGHSLGGSVTIQIAYQCPSVTCYAYNPYCSSHMLSQVVDSKHSYSKCQLYTVTTDVLCVGSALLAARGATLHAQLWNPMKGLAHSISQFIPLLSTVTMPLDLITGASKAACRGAFSMSQLTSSYTGPVVTVRRGSDNAVLNFYPGLNTPTASLADWLAGATGYVTKWFDQSGSGNHATQGSTVNQPMILNSLDLTFPASVSRNMNLPNNTVPVGVLNGPYSMIVKHGACVNTLQGTIIGAGVPTTKTANLLTFHSVTGGYGNSFWNADYYFGALGAVTGNVVCVTYDGSNVTGYVNGTASAPFPLTGFTNGAAGQFIGFDFHNSFNTAPNGIINYMYIFGSALPDNDRTILT